MHIYIYFYSLNLIIIIHFNSYFLGRNFITQPVVTSLTSYRKGQDGGTGLSFRDGGTGIPLTSSFKNSNGGNGVNGGISGGGNGGRTNGTMTWKRPLPLVPPVSAVGMGSGVGPRTGSRVGSGVGTGGSRRDLKSSTGLNYMTPLLEEGKRELLALLITRILHGLPSKLLPTSAWKDQTGGCWSKYRGKSFESLLKTVIQIISNDV